jgi:hypothetical protein
MGHESEGIIAAVKEIVIKDKNSHTEQYLLFTQCTGSYSEVAAGCTRGSCLNTKRLKYLKNNLIF